MNISSNRRSNDHASDVIPNLCPHEAENPSSPRKPHAGFFRGKGPTRTRSLPHPASDLGWW